MASNATLSAPALICAWLGIDGVYIEDFNV